MQLTGGRVNSAEKVAIITGAGSGIGRAAAVALAAAGYHVVLAGRREENLQETAGLADGSALVVATDIAERDAVVNLFSRSRDAYGRLDVLFNNAGVFPTGALLEDIDYADWQLAIDVNLTGAFLCTQQAFKLMKEQQPQGGRIINNGSISAHVPRPNSAPYTATKHAMTGLTKSTSLDGRKYNIACGQIDIGNAATTMTEHMGHGVPQADGTIAAEPTMDIDDVARAVVYMAGLPLNANVQFMTLMAAKMPFVGRG